MSNSDDQDNGFPVLKDVVTPGDESIIKTSRLGHEVIREIEELEQKTGDVSPAELSRNLTETEVDKLVDQIVTRHSEAMRVELKALLSQLVSKSGRN